MRMLVATWLGLERVRKVWETGHFACFQGTWRDPSQYGNLYNVLSVRPLTEKE